MKHITIIWTIILVGLVSLLTVFGFKYKKVLMYKKLERQMVEVTKEYFKVKKIELKEKKINVTLKELIEFEPTLEEFRIDNCNGKVSVSKKWIIKTYESNIKCDNYNS